MLPNLQDQQMVADPNPDLEGEEKERGVETEHPLWGVSLLKKKTTYIGIWSSPKWIDQLLDPFFRG